MPGTNGATEKRLRYRKGPSWATAKVSHTNSFFPSPPEQCVSVQLCQIHQVKLHSAYLWVSSQGCAANVLHLTVFKWPHQQTDNQWDKEEQLARQLMGGGWGVDREKGGVYINGGQRAFTIPRSASASSPVAFSPVSPQPWRSTEPGRSTATTTMTNSWSRWVSVLQPSMCGTHSCCTSELYFAMSGLII